jgi:hypothetical protein
MHCRMHAESENAVALHECHLSPSEHLLADQATLPLTLLRIVLIERLWPLIEIERAILHRPLVLRASKAGN